MNSRERLLNVLEGKPVDFLPRTPILMQYAAEFIGSNYGEFAGDWRTLVRANVACARHFGTDLVGVISDPYCETQGFGAEIIYEPNTVPHCRKHPLEDTTDLSTLAQPDPENSTRMRARCEALRAYKAEVGAEYPIMGWIEGPAAEAGDLRTAENFLTDLYDDEGYAHELMSLCVDVALKFAKAQLAAGADIIGVGDALASQVSPDLYERLILPHEQRLVRGLKDMGALVRLHICGNITHLLPGIASLGIDILDVDHMVSLRQVRETVGPRVALGGNLDPVNVVLRGTPDTIRAALLDSREQAGSRFIVNAGCEIPSGTPEENLRALCTPIPER